MAQDASQERSEQLTAADEPKSAEQLRAEIDEVRQELGDTAAVLAAKTDVKARAREKAAELKERAQANPLPLAAAAGAFALALMVTRRRGRR